jgi:gluconate 2-dehydrogenase gamma chain
VPRLSRRTFLQHLTFLGGGVVLLGGCQRPENGPSTKASPATPLKGGLTERQMTTLAAACERVLPRDEDPGAVDANVPEYVVRQLKTPEMANIRSGFIKGLDVLERRSQGRFKVAFFEAPADQQDALLRDFKNMNPASGEARFYELLVVLTLEGFLGDPSYGGNKDYVGWKLVGFGTSSPGSGYDGAHALHHHRGG